MPDHFSKALDNVRQRLAGLVEHGAWSLVWGGFLALTLVVVAQPWLAGRDTYSQPISGMSALSGESKIGDYRSVSLLIVGALLFSALSARLVAWIARSDPAQVNAGRARARSAHLVLLVAALPSVVWLARLLLVSSDRTAAPIAPAAWLVLGHLVLLTLGRWSGQLDGPRLLRWGLLGLALAFLAHFAAAGLAVTGVRVLPRRQLPAAPLSAILTAGAALGWLCLAWIARRCADPEQLERALLRALLVVQAPLPLLFLALVPMRFRGNDGTWHTEAGRGLWIVATLLAVAGAVAWWRSWRRLTRACAEGAARWALAFSALPIAAIAVLVAAGRWSVPVLPADDWHFGERWVTWQQWVQFGKVPFVDNTPIFGLHSFVVGGLSHALFQPTVAGWLGADAIVMILLASATCLAAFGVAGAPAALFVAMWPAVNDRLAMLAPCLLLLAHPGLVARPARWLACWPAIVGLAIVFNPSSGCALALGSLPCAAWMLGRAVGDQRPALLRVTALWLVLVVILLLLTPAGRMALGFLDSVRTMGQHYDLHAGLAEALVWNSSGSDSLMASASAHLLWEGAWIGATLLLLGALARDLVGGRTGGTRSGVFLASTTVLSTFFLVRWCVTRFDFVGWSRTGLLSYAWLGAIVPAFVALRGRGATIAVTCAVLAALLVPFRPDSAPDQLARSVARSVQPRRVPDGAKLVDGFSEGLPQLGLLAVDDTSHLQLIHDMCDLVDQHTRLGQPLFDLANRPALYAYAARPMAARYPSGYYLGNDRLQRQALADFERTPPAAVFFAPAITHGDGPCTLRSFRVARAILLHYRPVQQGEAVLLVAADSSAVESPAEAADRLATIDRVINNAGKSYDENELKMLPLTWGASWDGMRDQFESLAALPVAPSSGEPMSFRVDLSAVPNPGRAIEFLKLEIEWTPPRSGLASLELAWSTRGRAVRRPLSMGLSARLASRAAAGSGVQYHGTLVVPVGEHPRWLFGEEISDVTLKSAATSLLVGFRVLSCEALRQRG